VHIITLLPIYCATTGKVFYLILSTCLAVLQAALATSVATGFFNLVLIKAQQFVDSALGANNSVNKLEGEAANI
jgi:hypothetical protein